jgi:hypothetical protein
LKNFGLDFTVARFGGAGCCPSAATADAPLSARQMRTAENEFLIVMLLFVDVKANVAMTIWRDHTLLPSSSKPKVSFRYKYNNIEQIRAS